MEIFKLFGSIMVDTKDAESSISKTTDKAEGLGTKLKSGIGKAAKWGAAVVGAATAVGAAMMSMAKSSADALGDIDDAAQRLGVDAETMQELQYVAEMSGMSMSDLEKAAKKLEGTDLNLDDAINEIMSLGTAEEQTQRAIELFGESVAYKMQPLLNQGAEGIEAFKEQARDLGIIISNDAVEAGASFGDMYDAVTKSLESVKTQLATELMPYVVEILQWVIDNLPAMKETIKSVVEAIWPIVKAVLDLIMKALPPIMDAVKKILDWLMPYLKPVIDAITVFIQAFFKLFEGDFEGFVNSIKELVKALGTALYGIGKDVLEQLLKGFKSVWSSIKTWFEEKVQWIKDKLNVWKDSKLEMEGDNPHGSHASGLNYVPFDGYKATLHKGETVLSNGNTQNMVSDIVNALSPFMGGGAQTLQVVLDSKVIAEALYDPLNKVQVGRSVANG